jgi:hypothetical protein
MTACDRIRAEAPGLAALRADDPERVAALAHARGCPECERALCEGERLQSLLARVEPEPLPAGALERVRGAVQEALRREARRRLVASVAALCVLPLVLVGFARSRSGSGADWALAAVLWSLAVAVASAGRAGPIAATGAAALVGTAGPLDPSLGLECAGTELASAATVVLAAWIVARRDGTSVTRSTLLGAAVAGALAGDAALQLTCAARTSAPHLLAFHVGGVLLAAAAASALGRVLRRANA